jgi:hypothetical protein
MGMLVGFGSDGMLLKKLLFLHKVQSKNSQPKVAGQMLIKVQLKPC